MNLGWFQSILFGLISGLTEFLPVSSQAHRALFLRLIGAGQEPAIIRLLVHLAALGGIILARRNQWQWILRERAILHTPKRRRARAPHAQALQEWRLIFSTTIWCLLGMLVYLRAIPIANDYAWLSLTLLLNALILAAPFRFARGDKDWRNMTPLDTICIGLAGSVSVVPGISPIGTTCSIASIRGVGRTYGVDLCLLLMIPYLALLSVLDLAAVISAGAAGFAAFHIVSGLLIVIFSFTGAYFGAEMLRRITIRTDLRQFAYYSFGLSLLTFVCYLLA